MGMFISNELAEMLGWQVIQSINILQDGLDDEGWPTNCCPICCGPCSSLNEILDDPIRLGALNDLLMSHPYVRSGWGFWKSKGQTLRVKRIKAMWFKLDGTHKAICAWSDGKDISETFHRPVLKKLRKARHG
jgi:hypothetical protein